MDDQQEILTLETPTIKDVIDSFIKHIDSLKDTYPLTTNAVEEAMDNIVDEIAKFSQKYLVFQDEKSKLKANLNVTQEQLIQLNNLTRRLEKSILAYRLVQRSFVISLISQFDAFLGELIRVLFLIQPESLNASEKNITFSQLQNFESIEAAKEYIIEKEIEGVLRKSHTEQFDWLENKFGLKLREGLSIWPTFIEITERRNLFVHNRGIITNQYLSVCNKHNIDLQKDIQIGDQLQVTAEYFRSVYECIFEVGVKLAHVLWRKLQPADRESADQHLNNISYDLLAAEQFKLASILLDFATSTLKKYADEQRRLTFVVNKAQAYKWMGNSEAAKKIISSEDWSATNDVFKLAEAVILDEFDKANDLVKKIGKNGDISKTSYREWPLFREFRLSEGFIRTFEEVFGEPSHPDTTELDSQIDKILRLSTKIVTDSPSEKLEITLKALNQEDNLDDATENHSASNSKSKVSNDIPTYE